MTPVKLHELKIGDWVMELDRLSPSPMSNQLWTWNWFISQVTVEESKTHGVEGILHRSLGVEGILHRSLFRSPNRNQFVINSNYIFKLTDEEVVIHVALENI